MQFAAHFTPSGPIMTAEAGSLTEFLLERYLVYALTPRGDTVCTEINHRPWPLQTATGRLAMVNFLPARLRLPPVPPQLHYCSALEVWTWPAQCVLEAPAPAHSPRPAHRGERPEVR